MKITMLTLADAGNLGPDGKLNALGLGVRVIRRQEDGSSIVPLVILALAEATDADHGSQPIRISLQEPSGKRRGLIDDSLEVTPSPPEEADLPNEVRVQVSMPFLVNELGIHTLRMQLGKATANYRFVVVPRQD